MSIPAQKPAPAAITPSESYPELAQAIGIPILFLKREDLHPLGSHKGRSIPFMIDRHIAADPKNPRFIISSSGNAALAAGLYVQELNKKIAADNAAVVNYIDLEILVGKNISSKKLKKLQDLRDEHIAVSIHDRPLQVLTVKTHENADLKSLRQSVDDTALAGYDSLAEELDQIPDLEAVFIGTSSGTTAQALAEYFSGKNLHKNQKNGHPTAIHIVQTPSCHPMVESVDESESSEKSIADAIVDQVAHRKAALLPLIQETNGAGWIANNESLRIAHELVLKHAGLNISTNSALSVAGLMDAVYTGTTWTGAVACIIAGE